LIVLDAIPLIETCELNLNLYEEKEKVWEIFFRIRNDENHYSMCIVVDETWKMENFYGYEKQSPDEPDEIYLVEGVEEPNWVSHVFHQGVNIIKRHSKFRLSLLHYLSIHHINKFKPLSHYQEPDKIIQDS